jgi:ubiquinone/menaquinone biosynthesis C-methylase UbiE
MFVQVVEVGMGTGPSLQYYARAEVGSIIGVEPNLAMHPVAREEATRWGVDHKLRLVAGFAERLPLPDASVDVVVATMLLCTVKDMDATMREFERVLRPGGRYVFIEHIAAPPGSALRVMQNMFDPLQVVRSSIYP